MKKKVKVQTVGLKLASFALTGVLVVLFSGNSMSEIANHFKKTTSTTSRVSVVDQTGLEANGSSRAASFSDDGRYIVFTSQASNLVSGDVNGLRDVFLHDRDTGVTELISVNSSGVQANAESFAPVVSNDGRYVVFHSLSNTLVANDTNNRADVFVRDRSLSTTTRVSVDSIGTQGNGESIYPSISDDGNFVVFVSHASNLVVGDANAKADIFLHDRSTGNTSRVSVDSNGVEGNDESLETHISGNGQFIVFSSKSTNLVLLDTNDCMDIFVHEVATGITSIVSVHDNGAFGNRASSEPRISNDGNGIVFSSRANNLVNSDSNGYRDVFFHDRQQAKTILASLDSTSQQISMPSQYPDISGSGRFVSFSSLSPSIVSGDTNGQQDIFVYDRATQTTSLFSSDSSQTIGNGKSQRARLSGGGQFIVFESSATNLVVSDSNAKVDIFYKENNIALPEVSVSSAKTVVSEESEESVDFTFQRSLGTELALTVDISSTEGGASSGIDFAVLPTSISFPAGVDSVVITTSALNDTEVESGESIKVRILPGAGYVTLPGTDSALAKIESGEKPGVEVRTSKVFYETGGERLTKGEIVFTRSGGSLEAESIVNFTLGGSAINGVDYQAISNQVTIPAESEHIVIEVQSIDDAEEEGLESIEVQLVSNIDFDVVPSPWNKLYLLDNDRCFAPVVKNLMICNLIASFVKGEISNEEFEFKFKKK